MSNVEILFEETYGYEIKVTILEYSNSSWSAKDISGFTTKEYIIEKPDGTKFTKDASFDTDGTDGILTATMTEGDGLFGPVGHYTIQVKLSNASQLFKTDTESFEVNKAI